MAMTSESIARRFWPNEDPVGKRFQLDLGPRRQSQFVELGVIGIVKDVRFDTPTRIDPTHIYLPTGTPGSGLDRGFPRAWTTGHSGACPRRPGAGRCCDRGLRRQVRQGIASERLRLINLEDGEVRPQKAVFQLLGSPGGYFRRFGGDSARASGSMA